MHRAMYGRMHAGRCLQDETDEVLKYWVSDPRFIGCSVDVLPLLDKRCSGKQTCELRGTDDELRSTRPCQSIPQMAFLEADYYCATGYRPICYYYCY